MTETPIYDQIRRELRERPEQLASTGARAAESSGGISVWALIDRTQRATDRRR